MRSLNAGWPGALIVAGRGAAAAVGAADAVAVADGDGIGVASWAAAGNASEMTVGLYSINPKTQRSKWVAIDADYKNAVEHLLKLQYELTQDGVEPALEKSNRGGHLWIFFEQPALARDCRVYIYHTALRLGLPIKGAGLPEGIEIFPRQDEIGPTNSGMRSAHRSACIVALRKAGAGGSGSTTRITPSRTNWHTLDASGK